MPYLTKQAASDIFFPSGLRYYWKANLFTTLTDRVLDAFHELGSRPHSPVTIVAIEHYHGAFNRVAPDATAYPHRDAHYQLVTSSAWQDAADDAAGIAYARDLYAATRADAKDGQFLNFNSLEGAERTERIPAGYGPNWSRLRDIKRHYDPANLFRGNSNIPPAE
jgi:FAD/FMN-containing dehydrogenase